MHQLGQAYLICYDCNKNANRIFGRGKKSIKDKESF